MVYGRAEFGASTFCASCHANEQCGANGLPLTPNSIRILGRFQRLKTIEHPRLCAYLDLVRTKQERVIVATEHYKDNLFNRIQSRSLDSKADSIVQLAYDVLLALSHINSLGFVHRNLSPRCILFDSQGNTKLSNYGLYHMTGHGSDVAFPIGVPKYLCPEVLCGRCHVKTVTVDVDSSNIMENSYEAPLMLASSAKTDVWSLGVILLEVAMGRFLWEKLSLRQIFFKVISFLKSDNHPLDSIAREHQSLDIIESLPVEVTSLLKSCLTVSHSSRPLPCDLLQLGIFDKFRSNQISAWNGHLKMFSQKALCLELDLNINDDSSCDADAEWSDLLSQRNISEIYYLWKLAGGDLEGSLRKAGHLHQQPPIMKLPRLIVDDGEYFGESRDKSSLFDDTVVILSQEQLRQRLKDVEPTAYFPLLENEVSTLSETSRLTASHSSVDLQECVRLPIVIREKDVEYQFYRVILFQRLLQAYPYKRQQLLKEARVDVPPLFRAQIWAAVLEIEGDVQGRYEAIDKESPIPTDRQIEVDIPRCHQYNELLSSPSGHGKFKRILKAWVVSHPEYVYWQGLDSLCAPFLYLNFNNEALAYACLSAFIPKYLHNVFLKDNACIIQEYLTVFCHLIAFHDPQLSNHLDEIGFIPDLYAIPWFLTMYAHVFPLHKIFHLWDTLLLGNSSFPLCIGVAILHQLRDQLLTFGFNECILLFSDMPEIDIEKCVQESIRIFCSTPKSATFRQYAKVPKVESGNSKAVHSYYTQDYHDMPKSELSMEPVPLDELKSEKFSRISAEDLIELCELTGPFPGPSPSKRNKSTKPVIVIIDVRSEDEFKRGAVPNSVNIPFHSAFGADGSLLSSPSVNVLNQHRSQVKVVIGGSRGRHASHFAESLIRLGYSKVCVLHKGIDVLRSARVLTVPTPEL